MSIDYTGVGLVWSPRMLEVVLDKGQEEDWLSSHFIVVLSVIAKFAVLARPPSQQGSRYRRQRRYFNPNTLC